MKDKKIFFFDIDGTLAMGKDVSVSTQLALEKIRKNDDYVFICTGRPFQYADKYFQQYVDGFISSNGRHIVYQGKDLSNQPLDQKLILYFIEVMRKHHCGFAFLNHDHGYLEHSDVQLLKKIEQSYYPGYYITDFRDEDIRAYMFDIYFPDERTQEIVQEELKDQVIFNRHYPYLSADSTIYGVDKGSGIDIVLDYFGISKENAYAFGDGTNDVCMFSHVLHSIAMGNAIDQLKDVAEYVTDSIDHDGIEKALKYYKIID